jgi:hypothetical protein
LIKPHAEWLLGTNVKEDKMTSIQMSKDAKFGLTVLAVLAALGGLVTDGVRVGIHNEAVRQTAITAAVDKGAGIGTDVYVPTRLAPFGASPEIVKITAISKKTLKEAQTGNPLERRDITYERYDVQKVDGFEVAGDLLRVKPDLTAEQFTATAVRPCSLQSSAANACPQ